MKKCKRANEKKWGRALGKRAEVSKAYVKQGSSKLHWQRTANHTLWKTRRLCRTQVTISSVSAVPFISPNKYQRCLRSNQSLQNNIKIHLWLISNIYTCPIDCLIFLSIFTTSWERKQETRSRVQIREVLLVRSVCGCWCWTYPLARCRSQWGVWGRSWSCWLGRWRSVSSWRDCSSYAPGCGSQGVVRNT